MSIIFKKLEDIAREPLQDNSMEGGPIHQRKIYTLKKTIFFSSGFFIAAAAVILLVTVIFSTLFFLKKNFDSAVDNAVAVEKPHAENLHNSILPDAGRMVSDAAAPGSVPGYAHVPGILSAAGGSGSSANAGSGSYTGHNVSFTPPDSFLQQKKHRLMHRTVFLNPDKTSKFKIRVPDGRAYNHAAGPAQLSCKSPDNRGDGACGHAVAPVQGKFSTMHEKPALAVRKVSHMKPDSFPNVMNHSGNKSVVNGNGSDEKIEKLAADLDEAFREKNNKKTDKLLTELIRLIVLKKDKTDYYLKLIAFKEIRKKRYDSAERFLNRILAKNGNDFEAGINMAVIEIRQHQYSAARKRLIRLKELYPSRNEIDTLLNRL